MTNAHPFRSIRGKLLLSYSLLAVAMSAFVFVFLPARLKDQAQRTVEAKAVAIRDMAAFSISAALVFDDSATIEQVLSSAASSTDVSFVFVRDTAGRILSSRGSANHLPDLTGDGAREGHFTRDGLSFVSTTDVTANGVRDGGAPVGSLTIGISLRTMRAEIMSARRLGLVVGMVILAVGVLVAFVIATIVTRPLHGVAQTMNEIAAGDITRRASQPSDVELASLVGAFNSMVDALAGAQKELSTMNRDLEVRVEDRTAKLSRSIEEQRRVQGALKASEAQARNNSETLQSLIDVAPQAIVAVDAEWNVTRWNKAAESLFGWTAEETIGKPVPYVPADELEVYRQRQSQLVTANTQTPTESQRLHKDGHTICVLVSASVLFDRDQNVAGYIAILTDLSERKLLDEQLRQSQKMEAVGRLAGGVAHDFNNILTVIASYAALLYERETRSEERDDLQQITSAAGHAAALTRQLLTFSRRQILQLAPLSMREVVHHMEPMLRRVLRENITLTTTLSSSGGTVTADRTHLEQVLMNLVVNASDAMPDGGTLTIETHNVSLDEAYAREHPDVKPGPYVALIVRDTGVGMDAATIKRIFEPFFTTKAVGLGTGLGLATTYAVVNQLGGQIDVTSEPGQGTAFHIYFPRNAPDESEGSRVTGAADSATDAIHSETVLLVEDQDSVRRVVKRGLEKNGFRVLEAASGESALVLADGIECEIDVLVTDLMMPGLNGRVVADKLTARSPELKVVYMSGYADDTVGRQGLTGPGHTFLQKPFAAADLAKAIRELIGETVVVRS